MPQVQSVRVSHSFYLVFAVVTFTLGVILYLVSISSTAWQGIHDGLTISLWKACYWYVAASRWACDPWPAVPDFVRSAQAFSIITLLCHCVTSLMLITSFFVRVLQRSKVALIILSLMTFTSACMIAMAVVVMGIKGKDYLYELKQNDAAVFHYYSQKGAVLSGHYEIGWALILAVFAALVNFISFLFFLLEYKDVTEQRVPVKV